MKTHFTPASDTIAVLAHRGTDTPVAKLDVSQNCMLLVYLASIVKGVFTLLDKKNTIALKTGMTVYFVQSEQAGYSYIVFLYENGTSLCSCKDGRNHRQCPHTAEAALYEACCQSGTGDAIKTYEFPSESNPNYTYSILVKNGEIDDSSHEDCPGFHWRRHCKHMNAVIAALYSEAKAA